MYDWVAKLNVAIHPCRLKGSRYTESTVFRFCRVQPTFGSEWFGNFGRNSFYTNLAGENHFSRNFFVQVWLYWFPSTHTVKGNTEKSQSIEDNMATASIGPNSASSQASKKNNKRIYGSMLYTNNEKWGKIPYMNTKHTKYHQHSINRENSFTLKGNKDKNKNNKNILNFPTLRHLPQKFVIKSEQHVCFFFYVICSTSPCSIPHFKFSQ